MSSSLESLLKNTFVASFDGKFRDRAALKHWFMGLADARRVVDDWCHRKP